MAYTIASQVTHEWYTAVQHGWTSGEATFNDLARGYTKSGPRSWCFSELRIYIMPVFERQRLAWYQVKVRRDFMLNSHVFCMTTCGFRCEVPITMSGSLSVEVQSTERHLWRYVLRLSRIE